MPATVLPPQSTPTRRPNHSNTRGHEARNATTETGRHELAVTKAAGTGFYQTFRGRRTPAGNAGELVGMRGGRPLRMLTCLARCLMAGPCVCLAACTVFPQDVFLPTEVLVAREEAAIQQGRREFRMPVIALGGKGSYTRQTNTENILLTYDNEKSFRDGMVAAGTGIYAWGNAVGKKASEETARVTAQEGTKKSAAAEAAKLEALKEQNRHAEALMEMEAAAPVVPVPVP